MDERVGEAWDRRAFKWTAWARTPGHDVYFTLLNRPAFERLLPPPGRLTLDLGCGEGRVGRLLQPAGHRLVGIDSSPTLAALAREAGGYERVLDADAAAIPLDDGAVDLVVAFMSLHDMDDPAHAVAESARVLEPGGRLCAAIVHPLNRSEDSLAGYFEHRRVAEQIERNGLKMTFEAIDRPLEYYTRALEQAGFVVEALREPRADDATVQTERTLAPAGAQAVLPALALPAAESRATRSASSSRRRASLPAPSKGSGAPDGPCSGLTSGSRQRRFRLRVMGALASRIAPFA